MRDSVFTKIINGEIPCHKIYEDEKIFAMLDIDPLSDGHTLVFPKIQVDKIYDLDTENYTALFDVARKIAQNMEKILGVRIGFVVEGLAVPHAHIHLVPLYDGDVLQLHHGYPVKKTDADLAEIAEKLRITE